MSSIYNSAVAQEARAFYGTENWYQHALDKSVVFTDGIKWLREKLNCFWLIDDIVLQSRRLRNRENTFMALEFTNPTECEGKLSITDGKSNTLKNIDYEFTDLSVSIHANNNRDNVILLYLILDEGMDKFVLMLPSEY